MNETYQLKGNPVVDVPIVGNLIYDELGKEVIAKFNERFKGIDGIEYTYKHKKDEPISYSNVPRVLGMNQELRKLTDGKITLLNPEQVIRFWDVIPEKKTTYADIDGISLYPNEGPNEDLRQQVIKLIGRSSKLPLIVPGLGVKRADNKYGFEFTGTDYMRVIEAPFLKKNGKLAYDSDKEGLVDSDKGVNIWTLSDQSGLRWLYRSWDVGLIAGSGDLFNANDDGRVQVISGGAASPNLEAYLKRLEDRKAEAEENIRRIAKAESILKGE